MHALKAVLLAIALLATPAAVSCADEPAGTATVASLEDRLKTGLRARRPQEVAFIKDVVQLVQRGELPGKLVDSAYLWAIRHQTKYPFPAYERALRIQADRIGIDL